LGQYTSRNTGCSQRTSYETLTISVVILGGTEIVISSAITNPLTTGGKVVDVALEMWAIFVVTGVNGLAFR
jgi:hypothetical protein